MISLLLITLLSYHFIFQYRYLRVLAELRSMSRCHHCYVKKDSYAISFNQKTGEIHAKLNGKYCTSCHEKITRKKKLNSLLSKKFTYYKEKFDQFQFEKKFDNILMWYLISIFILALITVIIFKGETSGFLNVYNFGNCIYWILLVRRNYFIKKKVQEHDRSQTLGPTLFADIHHFIFKRIKKLKDYIKN